MCLSLFQEFNAGLLGRTPEESVSRLLTSSFNSHRDFMVRFGLGLYLEHGFYQTPMGETAYLMQLKQISNATIDTVTYGALFYLLNCHPFRDTHSGHRLEQNASINNLDRAFQEEIENWAIVQKSEDGLILMYNKMQEEFRNRNNGQEGDIVLVPNGTKMYAAGRPENRYFYFTGKTKGTQDPLPGVALTESRPFRQGADQPADDPAFRERVIGGFFHMLNSHLQHVPAEDYQTSMMDTYIYSETSDDYVRISFKEAVKYLGLYEWPGSDDYPGDATRYNVGVGADAELDIFTMTRPTIAERSRNVPATTYGMRFWGSLTSWGKAYESTGLLQRAIQKILSLDAEAVDDFLKRFGGASGQRPAGATSNTGSAKNTRVEVGSGAPSTTGVVDPSLLGSNVNAADQPDEEMKEVEAGEAYFTPVRARNAAGEQYNQLGQLIARLPTDYKSINKLLHEYQSAGRSLSQDDGQAFVKLVYKLRESFYSADRDAAVLELGEAYDAAQDDSRLTGPEAKLLATARGQPIKEAESRAANTIAWLPRGEGHINEKALLLVSVYKRHTVPVRQPSDALTLTTKHAVLFDLTTEQYKAFLGNKGVIQYISRDVDDSLYADRLALLQYSVAISALYKKIAAVTEKSINGRGGIQKIIPELKTLVSEQHPLGESYSLAEDLMSAVFNKQLPSLTGQYLVDEVIQALQGLAIHLFSGADDSVVISEVQKVVGAYTSAKLASPHHHTVARDIHRALAAEADIPDVSIIKLLPRASPTDGALVKQWSEEAKKLVPDILAKGVGASFPTKEEWENVTPAILASYVVLKQKNNNLKNGGFGSFILFQAQTAKKVQAQTKGHFIDAFYAGVTAATVQGTDARLKEDDIKLPKGSETDNAATTELAAWKELETLNQQVADELTTHLSQNINSIKKARAQSGYGLGKKISGRDAISTPMSVNAGAKNISVPAGKTIESILRNLPTADGEYLFWALENNVPVPVGILGWRPHKRYLAGTSLVMRGRGEAAFTWWAKADFQLGDNVAQKMLFGHFTMYAKTIVHNTRKVVHHYNSFVKEYLGGNGHAFWNPLDGNDRSDYESGELNKDIFFTATRADFRVTQNHLSLTGEYPQQLSASADAQAATKWGASNIYNEMWGWRVGGAYNPITEHHSKNAGAKFNVVCFQEHQRLYNYKGNKTGEFDLYVIDKGHWGPRVYAGCGAVRRGKQKYLAAPAYLSEKTTTLTP